jgi:hypothetical protein
MMLRPVLKIVEQVSSDEQRAGIPNRSQRLLYLVQALDVGEMNVLQPWLNTRFAIRRDERSQTILRTELVIRDRNPSAGEQLNLAVVAFVDDNTPAGDVTRITGIRRAVEVAAEDPRGDPVLVGIVVGAPAENPAITRWKQSRSAKSRRSASVEIAASIAGECCAERAIRVEPIEDVAALRQSAKIELAVDIDGGAGDLANHKRPANLLVLLKLAFTVEPADLDELVRRHVLVDVGDGVVGNRQPSIGSLRYASEMHDFAQHSLGPQRHSVGIV